MIYESEVPGHEGPCTAVWLNRNQVYNRIDQGISGFFRPVRKPGKFWARRPEFHGVLRNGIVESTEGSSS